MILFNDYTQISEFVSAKTTIGCQGNRIQPEFCVIVIPLDMNMRRLKVLPAVEEETVRTDSQYRGHLNYTPSNFRS